MITFINAPAKSGGPSIFTKRLAAELEKRGYEVAYGKKQSKVLFLIGGTRNIFWLIMQKMKGSKILQRLDGTFWQHRYEETKPLHYLKCEIRNILMLIVYKLLANVVVFQSNYVKKSWIIKYGKPGCKHLIIYNASNSFAKNINNSNNRELVCVEGSVNGKPAYRMLEEVGSYVVNVYGDYDKTKISNCSNLVNFHGTQENTLILSKFEGKKVFLCLETNPACPNSVIEALSHGIPVVGFNSGSLMELVGDGGIVLPYEDANPDLLEVPNLSRLNETIKRIFEDYEVFSNQAHLRAEKMFGFKTMADKYEKAILSIND